VSGVGFLVGTLGTVMSEMWIGCSVGNYIANTNFSVGIEGIEGLESS